VKKYLIILVAALLAATALAAGAAPATTRPVAQSEAPTGHAQPSPPAGQPGLSGTKWILTELNGAAPIADHVPTLEFGADGQATGNGSCNQYFGSYTIDDDTLNFGQLGSTMMACEEPVMPQEISFLQTLGTAAIFTVAGDTLTITTAADATLVFTRVA
jgi:heat shock protein HslJ